MADPQDEIDDKPADAKVLTENEVREQRGVRADSPGLFAADDPDRAPDPGLVSLLGHYDQPLSRRAGKLIDDHAMEGGTLTFRINDAADPADMSTIEDDGETLRHRGKASSESAAVMAELAEARGWQSVDLTGSKAFKEKMWLECRMRGIGVTGFEPDEKLQKKFAAMQQVIAGQDAGPAAPAAAPADPAPRGANPPRPPDIPEPDPRTAEQLEFWHPIVKPDDPTVARLGEIARARLKGDTGKLHGSYHEDGLGGGSAAETHIYRGRELESMAQSWGKDDSRPTVHMQMRGRIEPDGGLTVDKLKIGMDVLNGRAPQALARAQSYYTGFTAYHAKGAAPDTGALAAHQAQLKAEMEPDRRPGAHGPSRQPGAAPGTQPRLPTPG